MASHPPSTLIYHSALEEPVTSKADVLSLDHERSRAHELSDSSPTSNTMNNHARTRSLNNVDLKTPTHNTSAPESNSNTSNCTQNNTHGHEHDSTDTSAMNDSTSEKPIQNFDLENPPSSNNNKPYLNHTLTPSTSSTTFLLLLLALATGINDSATFIDYHIFVSNQTGNTVFLGIGSFLPSTSRAFDLRHVGLSLGGFCLGGLLTGQLGHHITGKRTRGWIILNNLLQTLLTLSAAALRQWYATTASPSLSSSTADDARTYAVIALLAVASGAQVAVARGLGLAEIPTGMITSAWIDLTVDPQLLRGWFWSRSKRNQARDRRVGFVGCILIGGFVGAAAGVYCAPALPLLLAGIVKAVVTVGFFFGTAEEEKIERRKEGSG